MDPHFSAPNSFDTDAFKQALKNLINIDRDRGAFLKAQWADHYYSKLYVSTESTTTPIVRSELVTQAENSWFTARDGANLDAKEIQERPVFGRVQQQAVDTGKDSSLVCVGAVQHPYGHSSAVTVSRSARLQPKPVIFAKSRAFISSSWKENNRQEDREDQKSMHEYRSRNEQESRMRHQLRRGTRTRHQFDPHRMPSGTQEMEELTKRIEQDSDNEDVPDQLEGPDLCLVAQVHLQRVRGHGGQ